jgi:hypothetical protein
MIDDLITSMLATLQSLRSHPPIVRDRAEGEGKVTDQPTTFRFVLRKGTVEGKWMIWDRERRGPARLERGLACELSEEQARNLLEHLTRAKSGK